MASSLLKFLNHTRRRTTVGTTSLDEWSARGRDLYLTKHNTQKRDIRLPGRRSAAHLCLRPRSHRDRREFDLGVTNCGKLFTADAKRWRSCRSKALRFLRDAMWVTKWAVDCIWNVMAHAQKPYFVFRRNGRVYLNRQGRQFSRLLAAEVCASAVVMLDTPCS